MENDFRIRVWLHDPRPRVSALGAAGSIRYIRSSLRILPWAMATRLLLAGGFACGTKDRHDSPHDASLGPPAAGGFTAPKL